MDPVKINLQIPTEGRKTACTESDTHSPHTHAIFSLITFSNITSSLLFKESILEFKQGQSLLDQSAQFQSSIS